MDNYKICSLNKGSIHYRMNIWMLMDKEQPNDFYYGDNQRDIIKPIDTFLLKNSRVTSTLYFKMFFRQKGALRLISKSNIDIIMKFLTIYCNCKERRVAV